MSPGVLLELHHLLAKMRGCKGQDCTHHHGKKYPKVAPASPAVNNHLREGLEEGHMTPLPTTPSNLQTSAVSSVRPLTSESPSVVLVTRSDVTGNSPKSVWNNISKPTTLEKFTTLEPKEVNVNLSEHSTVQSTLNTEREQQLMESLSTEHSIPSQLAPLPTANLKTNNRPDETSGMESNLCLNCSSSKSKKSDKEGMSSKIRLQSTVTNLDRSDAVPTVSVGSSGLNISLPGLNFSLVPTTSASVTPKSKENTGRMHSKISTPKPTKGKSLKKRKNGGRGGRKKNKDTSKGKPKNKSSKKSRKSKKKSPNGKRSSSSTENKKKQEITEKEMVVLNTTLRSPESPLNNNSKKSDHEKSQLTVTPLLGSQHVPTAFVNSSDPDTSSSKLNFSSIIATSAPITTSNEEITMETTTVKPTRRKSAGRRKNNNSNDRDRKKTTKKIRKMKKKVSERENSQTSEEIEQTIKAGGENQTGLRSKSTKTRPESENKDSKKGSKGLPEVSRKRDKKPANKRSANQKSKKKAKGKHSKQGPTQISQGRGIIEGGGEPPQENGTSFSSNPESSPSNP